MPSPAPLSLLTEAEYLASEESGCERREFVAGHVFAMSGGTLDHNTITQNLGAALRAHLRGGPCHVFILDAKVRVGSAEAFYYPDVVVTCDPGDRGKGYYVSAPRLIVEVLSPSTEVVDRREKLVAYRRIPGLHEYALIDQSRARIEIYRRVGTDWLHDIAEAGSTTLESVNLTIPLSVVYEDVLPISS